MAFTPLTSHSKDLTPIKEAFTRQLAPHWDKTAYRIFAFLEAQEDCSLEARLVIEALIVCFNLPAAVWKGQKGSKSVITMRGQICHFQVFSHIHILKVLSTEARLVPALQYISLKKTLFKTFPGCLSLLAIQVHSETARSIV